MGPFGSPTPPVDGMAHDQADRAGAAWASRSGPVALSSLTSRTKLGCSRPDARKVQHRVLAYGPEPAVAKLHDEAGVVAVADTGAATTTAPTKPTTSPTRAAAVWPKFRPRSPDRPEVSPIPPHHACVSSVDVAFVVRHCRTPS